MADELLLYHCVVQGGGGWARECLAPMLRAWASSRGVELADGTFNLCADEDVVPTSVPISLAAHAHLAQPAWRRNQSGFDPRLYPVVLDDRQQAWLFRWSDESHLRDFVGDTALCPGTRHCDVVAAVRLRTALRVEDGDTVTLRFED